MTGGDAAGREKICRRTPAQICAEGYGRRKVPDKIARAAQSQAARLLRDCPGKGIGGGKRNGCRPQMPHEYCRRVDRGSRMPPPKNELSRKCRSPLLFHPPLRQGGDLRLFAAFPWRSGIGGMASTKPTRNPFLNLWVKAQAWRTPQDNHWEHYSRRACRCQRGTGRFSTNCKT